MKIYSPTESLQLITDEILGIIEIDSRTFLFSIMPADRLRRLNLHCSTFLLILSYPRSLFNLIQLCTIYMPHLSVTLILRYRSSLETDNFLKMFSTSKIKINVYYMMFMMTVIVSLYMQYPLRLSFEVRSSFSG